MTTFFKLFPHEKKAKPPKISLKQPDPNIFGDLFFAQQSLPNKTENFYLPQVDIAEKFEESQNFKKPKNRIVNIPDKNIVFIKENKFKVKKHEIKVNLDKDLARSINKDTVVILDGRKYTKISRDRYKSECKEEKIIEKRRASDLVDKLLLNIYGRSYEREDRQIRVQTETDYGSVSSLKSLDGHCENIQYGRLVTKDISELEILHASLKERVAFSGNLLLKHLKKKDALRLKQEKLCNVVTAYLQAHSDKRSEDTNMRFSPAPPPGGDSSFTQWRDAMKMVAKLPGGIPSDFRRKLWLALAEKHLQSKGVNWQQSERLCFNEWTNPDDSELGIQIVKDLHRTGCSLFCGAAGQENQALLKRVLLAYARWNKNVGYCQGFNMLAALILQVMDKNETDSVKVMIYLIEGVLPESYFANNLRGLSVDMVVFRDLLRLRLPHLSKHLELLQNDAREGNSYEPPLTNVFTMQWFLTLFCNCLPQSTVLRVWDLIFLEGNEILLRTAIAIWERLSDRILAVNSADEFYSIMGVLTREMLEFGLVDSNTLIKSIVAIGTCSELNDMRDRYLYNITPWTQSVQTAAKKGFRFFYSDDDEVDSDNDERMAVTTAYGMSLGRKKERAQSLGNTIQPYAHGHPDRERLALDISALKKQYAKLRERQRQAHIILTAACARQPINQSTSPSPIAMNHLLLGKNAIVNAHGRRLGPPQGAVPPARTKTKPKEPETLHWKDAPKVKVARRISDEEIKSEYADTDSSSYDEDSSSTSTELCDENDKMSDFFEEKEELAVSKSNEKIIDECHLVSEEIGKINEDLVDLRVENNKLIEFDEDKSQKQHNKTKEQNIDSAENTYKDKKEELRSLIDQLEPNSIPMNLNFDEEPPIQSKDIKKPHEQIKSQQNIFESLPKLQEQHSLEPEIFDNLTDDEFFSKMNEELSEPTTIFSMNFSLSSSLLTEKEPEFDKSKYKLDLTPPVLDLAPTTLDLVPDLELKEMDLDVKDTDLGLKDSDLVLKERDLGLDLDLNLQHPDLEVKDLNLGLKDPDIGPKDPDVGPKDPDVGLKEQDVGIQDPDVRVKDSDEALKDPDLDLEVSVLTSPDLVVTTSNLAGTNPAVEDTAPDLGRKASELDQKASDSDLKASDLDLKASDLDLKASDLDLKASDLDLKTSDLDLKTSDSDLKASDLDQKASDSDLKASNLNLKTSDSDLKVSHLDQKASDSDQKSSDSDQKSSDLDVKASDLDVKVSDLDLKASDLKQKALELDFKTSEFNQKSSELNQKASDLNQKASDLNQKASDLDQKASDLDQKASDLDVKASSLDQKVSALDRKASDLDLKASGLDLKASDLDLKASDLDLKASDLEQRTTDLESKTAKLENATPILIDLSPALEASSPALGASSPALEPSSPALGASSPALEPSSPALGASSPALGASSPALGASSPALGASSPALGASSPALGTSSPALETSSPALEASSPALEASSPALEISSSNLDLKTSDLKIVNPSWDSEDSSEDLAVQKTSVLDLITPNLDHKTAISDLKSQDLDLTAQVLDPTTQSSDHTTTILDITTPFLDLKTPNLNYKAPVSVLDHTDHVLSPISSVLDPKPPLLEPISPQLDPKPSSLEPTSLELDPKSPSLESTSTQLDLNSEETKRERFQVLDKNFQEYISNIIGTVPLETNNKNSVKKLKEINKKTEKIEEWKAKFDESPTEMEINLMENVEEVKRKSIAEEILDIQLLDKMLLDYKEENNKDIVMETGELSFQNIESLDHKQSLPETSSEEDTKKTFRTNEESIVFSEIEEKLNSTIKKDTETTRKIDLEKRKLEMEKILSANNVLIQSSPKKNLKENLITFSPHSSPQKEKRQQEMKEILSKNNFLINSPKRKETQNKLDEKLDLETKIEILENFNKNRDSSPILQPQYSTLESQYLEVRPISSLPVSPNIKSPIFSYEPIANLDLSPKAISSLPCSPNLIKTPKKLTYIQELPSPWIDKEKISPKTSFFYEPSESSPNANPLPSPSNFLINTPKQSNIESVEDNKISSNSSNFIKDLSPILTTDTKETKFTNFKENLNKLNENLEEIKNKEDNLSKNNLDIEDSSSKQILDDIFLYKFTENIKDFEPNLIKNTLKYEDGSSKQPLEEDKTSKFLLEENRSSKRLLEEDGYSKHKLEEGWFLKHPLEEERFSKLLLEEDRSSKLLLEKDRSPKFLLEEDRSSKHLLEEDRSSKHLLEEDRSSKHLLEEDRSSKHLLEEDRSSKHLLEEDRSSKHLLEEDRSSKHLLEEDRSSKLLLEEDRSSKHLLEEDRSSKHLLEEDRSSKHLLEEDRSSKHLLEEDRSSKHLLGEDRSSKHLLEADRSSKHLLGEDRSSKHLLEADRSSKHLLGEDRSSKHLLEADRSSKHLLEADRSSKHLLGEDRSSKHLLEADRSSKHLLGEDRSLKHLLEADRSSKHLLEADRSSKHLLEEDRSSKLLLEEDRSSKLLLEEDRSSKLLLEEDRSSKHLLEEDRSSKLLLEEDRSSKLLLEEDRSSKLLLEEDRSSKLLLEEDRSSKLLLEEDRSSKLLLEEDRSSKLLLEEDRSSKLLLEEDRSSKHLLEEDRSSKHLLEADRSSKHLLEEDRSSKHLLEEDRSSKLLEEDRSSKLLEDTFSKRLEENKFSKRLEDDTSSEHLSEEDRSSQLLENVSSNKFTENIEKIKDFETSLTKTSLEDEDRSSKNILEVSFNKFTEKNEENQESEQTITKNSYEDKSSKHLSSKLSPFNDDTLEDFASFSSTPTNSYEEEKKRLDQKNGKKEATDQKLIEDIKFENSVKKDEFDTFLEERLKKFNSIETVSSPTNEESTNTIDVLIEDYSDISLGSEEIHDDRRLEAGRRNSERALKIIQENSLILHRILQHQSKSTEIEEEESPVRKNFARSDSLPNDMKERRKFLRSPQKSFDKYSKCTIKEGEEVKQFEDKEEYITIEERHDHKLKIKLDKNIEEIIEIDLPNKITYKDEILDRRKKYYEESPEQFKTNFGTSWKSGETNVPKKYDGDPKKFDVDPNKFDEVPKKFDEDLKKFGEDPKKFDEDPKKFGEGTKKFSEDPKKFGEGTKKFSEDTKKFGEGPKKFYEGPKKFDEDQKKFDGDTKKFYEDPKKFDEDTKKFGEGPKKFHEDPKKFYVDPKKFDVDPKKFDVDPKKIDVDPKKFDVDPNKFDEVPKKFDEDPKKFYEDPKKFDEGLKKFNDDPKKFNDDPKKFYEPPKKFDESAKKYSKPPKKENAVNPDELITDLGRFTEKIKSNNDKEEDKDKEIQIKSYETTKFLEETDSFELNYDTADRNSGKKYTIKTPEKLNFITDDDKYLLDRTKSHTKIDKNWKSRGVEIDETDLKTKHNFDQCSQSNLEIKHSLRSSENIENQNKFDNFRRTNTEIFQEPKSYYRRSLNLEDMKKKYTPKECTENRHESIEEFLLRSATELQNFDKEERKREKIENRRSLNLDLKENVKKETIQEFLSRTASEIEEMERKESRSLERKQKVFDDIKQRRIQERDKSLERKDKGEIQSSKDTYQKIDVTNLSDTDKYDLRKYDANYKNKKDLEKTFEKELELLFRREIIQKEEIEDLSGVERRRRIEDIMKSPEDYMKKERLVEDVLQSPAEQYFENLDRRKKLVILPSPEFEKKDNNPIYSGQKRDRSSLTINLRSSTSNSPDVSPQNLSCLKFTSFQKELPCSSKFSPCSKEKESPKESRHFGINLPTLSPPRRSNRSPASPQFFSPFPVQPTTRQPKELGIKLGLYKDLSPLKSPSKW